jgi:hypothetical protein
MTSRYILLVQGGLANQLLQLAIYDEYVQGFAAYYEVSDLLLSSRTRLWRGIQKRSLSFLLFKYLTSDYPVLIAYCARILCRLRKLLLARELECLSSVRISRSYFFMGDGLHPRVFTVAFDRYWQSLNSALDSNFGEFHFKPSVIAHVRRGDFLSFKVKHVSSLHALPLNYYTQAFAYLGSLVSSITEVILVSDDLPAASSMLGAIINVPLICSEDSTPERDLWLISHSSMIVLANSTLSAIGAHLACLRNSDVIVVAPKQWFLSADYVGSRFDLRKPSWHLI